MLASFGIPRPSQKYTQESSGCLPDVVQRLLTNAPGPGSSDDGWEAFVAAYSELLLRAAAGLSTDYDAVLDRYAYMLDELRRDDYRRIRRFVADGRSTFSTWLAVVARRLCLDHYRRRYGRLRVADGTRGNDALLAARRQCRRQISDLAGALIDVNSIEDPLAPDGDEVLDARERRVQLKRAVTRLSPNDRLLIQLRFEQELTGREIAALLGLPTPFHVYRRLEVVCAVLHTALSARKTSPSGPFLGTSTATSRSGRGAASLAADSRRFQAGVHHDTSS